ncbi:hypothetical protein M5K25_026369 [Dendrobium thyrsiflorum]|uniref:Uncharacterized protein n=1 Tax=Dendrobium thyrsiflorum TaxID=117978 RepID=A0ABD0TX44_DENTH
MTPLLSTVTYLIITGTPFDEAQLIPDYIYNVTDIRHPQSKRQKNVALGHLISYILEKKYNLINPVPPTELPIFSTNASFLALFNQDQGSEGDDFGEEGAPAQGPAPAPGSDQNFYQDMIQRFDRMETRFDQIENHMNMQDASYNEDMGWVCGQIESINMNVASINSYYTMFNMPPPPDQGPSNF